MILPAALFILLFTLSLVRFRIRVAHEPGRWRCAFQYGPFVLLDTTNPKTSEPRARRAVARQEKAQDQKSVPIGRILPQLPKMMHAAFLGLRFLFKRIRIERCKLSGRLEAADPAETGVLFGLLWAVVGVLELWLSSLHVNVVPGFDDGGTRLWFDAEASMRASTLVAFPVVLFFYVPKRALARFVIDTVRRIYGRSGRTKTNG
jgi:hypothetical protein